MKAYLFASAALMLLSAIPGALCSVEAEKLHLKGATAATAPDYFEEKFASVFAESESEENDLSGATAVTADADAAKDVCSTIGSAIGCNTTPGCSWGHNKCAPVGYNQEPVPPVHNCPRNPNTGKCYGEVANENCFAIGSAIGCNTTPGCSWGHNKCAPVGWNSAALATSTIATLATVAITLTAWLI